jgi:hypothetical protein
VREVYWCFGGDFGLQSWFFAYYLFRYAFGGSVQGQGVLERGGGKVCENSC